MDWKTPGMLALIAAATPPQLITSWQWEQVVDNISAWDFFGKMAATAKAIYFKTSDRDRPAQLYLVNFSSPAQREANSPPVATRIVPAVTIMPTTATNPDCVRMRRIAPMPADPKPAGTVPCPFAANPNVVRARRNDDRFNRRGRWRLLNDNWSRLRLRGCVTYRAWCVDHVIHHFIRHAGIAQVNDVRRTQMIDRMRILDLADDHILADARFGQRFHIRNRQRLALINFDVSCRRLRAQPCVLFLIHRIADQAAANGPRRRTDQCARPAIAWPADGRAGDRAQRPADQRAGTGVVLRAIRIDATGQQNRRTSQNQNQRMCFFHVQFFKTSCPVK